MVATPCNIPNANVNGDVSVALRGRVVAFSMSILEGLSRIQAARQDSKGDAVGGERFLAHWYGVCPGTIGVRYGGWMDERFGRGRVLGPCPEPQYSPRPCVAGDVLIEYA